MPARHGPFIRLWLLVIVTAVATGLGCSAGDEQPVEQEQRAGSDRVLSGRVGHLTVVSRDPLGRADAPMTVSAQFVDFAGVDERTVRRSLDLWSPDGGQGEEQCWLLEEATPIDPRDWYSSHIELLHAGTIILEAGTQRIELAPRPMPELLPYLSGYTYGTDTGQRPNYAAGLAVEIWSTGGDHVGGFEMSLEMPAPISIAYVGGSAVGSAEAVDVDFDSDVLVLWQPAIGHEIIHILLEEDGIDQRAVLSCTAFDDGAFLLSTEALRALLAEQGGRRIRLTLRRAHFEALSLAGFDRAEAVAITEHSVVLY